jgi:hypothetical protein
MTAHEETLVNRLLKAPTPSGTEIWETENNPYDAARLGVSKDDIPGLIDIARAWNDEDWLDEFGPDVDQDAASLLPVIAWRALGSLKAEAAVDPLLDILDEIDDEFDDWAPEELPNVFGKIGEVSFDPLMRTATDQAKPEFIRSTAARGLGCIAEEHPRMRGRVVDCLMKSMANADGDHINFNSTLLAVLVDLKAVEAAELIERAFAANHLDVGVYGDWEAVRQMLGVEGLRLPMPKNPHNTLADFRTDRGIGIFSEQPIFDTDECDPEVAQDYYDRAYDAFAASQEGQSIIGRYGSLGWFRSLLVFGTNYLGETVDGMTSASVQEFVLDYVPRKVSTDAKSARAIIAELLAFWEFLDRVYSLPAAKSVVEWLKTKGLVKELETELSDPSHFGMAKSLLSMGANAGFDMTSEAGINSFMQAYNASLGPLEVPQAPISREVRAGRNDPCPCGSGRKFKKCCGGSH